VEDLEVKGKTGVAASIRVTRLYTLTPPAPKSGNGVTATVYFDPPSPVYANTPVTATMVFTGMAAESRRFTVNLTSAKVGLAGDPRSFYTSISATSFASMDFAFTMPAQDVGAEDFSLDFNYSVSALTMQEMINDSVKFRSAQILGIATNTEKGRKEVLVRIATIENMFLQEITGRLTGTGSPGPHTFSYTKTITTGTQVQTLQSIELITTETTGYEYAENWGRSTALALTESKGTSTTIGASLSGELGSDKAGAKIGGTVSASTTWSEEKDVQTEDINSYQVVVSTNGDITYSDAATYSTAWGESKEHTEAEGWERTIEAGNIPLGKIWVGAEFARVSIYQVLEYHDATATATDYATYLKDEPLLYNVEGPPSFGVYEVSDHLALPPGLEPYKKITDVTAYMSPGAPYPVTLYPKGGTYATDTNYSDTDGKRPTVSVTLGKKSTDLEAAKIPSRTGCVFQGYYSLENCGGTQYFDKDGKCVREWDLSAISLYAGWKGDQYLVTFDKQSGTGGSSSVTATYSIPERPAPMPAIVIPTRTGYDFDGYYTQENGEGTQYYTKTGASARNWDTPEAAKTKEGGYKLYANWKAKQYTVYLYKQDGTGGYAQVTATYDDDMPLVSIPTRSGYYVFCGYNDSAGAKYYNYNGASVKTWDKAYAASLYAQWAKTRFEWTNSSTDENIAWLRWSIYTYLDKAALTTQSGRDYQHLEITVNFDYKAENWLGGSCDFEIQNANQSRIWSDSWSNNMFDTGWHSKSCTATVSIDTISSTSGLFCLYWKQTGISGYSIREINLTVTAVP